MIAINRPDIICVTEFAPKFTVTNVQDSELQIDGYVHCSNIDYYKRGAVIYVSKNLNMNPIDTSNMCDESVWVEISLKGSDKLLLGCVYRSPNSPEDNNQNVLECVRNMCDLPHSHKLICGDFNLPEIDWLKETTNTNENHIAFKFLECMRDCFLTQHVLQPTHHRINQRENILDLILTNEEQMITGLRHEAPIGASHHSSLIFKFQCYSEDNKRKVNSYRYNLGDYDELRKLLLSHNWGHLLEGKNCVESWELLLV